LIIATGTSPAAFAAISCCQTCSLKPVCGAGTVR